MTKSTCWKKAKIFFICFTLAFLFLMICTKSSFLYPMNDWTDANCFFTVGKSMLKGKILYLDLFEQKGPLLYLLHTLAAMISFHSFIGVFLLEIVSLTIFFYYAYKTLNLFVSHNMAIFCLPIIAFLILGLRNFSHGDSAEEFCLPILMYSLYSLTQYFKVKSPMSPSYKMFFLNGVMAGLIATIKFSLLGFWFAFMMCFFFLLLSRKEYRKSICSCLVFLGGMILPILPWIIYFIVNHAWNAFLEAYIYFNIFYYGEAIPPLMKTLAIIGKPLAFLAKSPGIGIPFLFGMFTIFYDRKFLPNLAGKLTILTTFIFLCIGVFFGSSAFRYYYIILTPFIVYGIASVARLLENNYHYQFQRNKEAIFMILTVWMLAFSFYATDNTTMIQPRVEKKELVQYRFAEIINQKKKATLLNYQFLDGGFYTAAGIVPNTKYFQKQNVNDKIYPDITQGQNKVLEKRQVDFVVTRDSMNRSGNYTYDKALTKNYKKIAHQNQNYEERRYRYTLWKKRKNPLPDR